MATPPSELLHIHTDTHTHIARLSGLFCTILWGQRIKIYTDHKNLTCKNIINDRVLRWRLLLEEYGPDIVYIKGENNNAADAMSRLPIEEHYCFRTAKVLCNLPTEETCIQECYVTDQYMSETYGIEELETGTFPLTYKIIDKYQRKDKQLLKILKRTIDSNISTDHTNNYHTKSFRGGGTDIDLICRNEKNRYFESTPKVCIELVSYISITSR